MNRFLLPILFASFCLLLLACPGREPEGIIKVAVEPWRDISHPLYYWETIDGKTAVYRIAESTSEIYCLLYDLHGVRSMRASATATYILRIDRRGRLALSRLEADRTMVTDVSLENELTAEGEVPWFVSRGDVVVVAGAKADETSRVVAVSFSRKEPEETFRQDRVNQPDISWEETEWFSTLRGIGSLALSPDASRLAVSLPLDDGSGKHGLYLVNEPGGTAERIGEYPVVELAGFSPDGEKLLVTFEIEGRVELFLIEAESGSIERLTVSTRWYRTGHPAWHPSGRHFIYTTDFTTEFREEATLLSGEQLYLYSLDSRNSRRLTAFEGMTLRVDFAPNGDFLLYASSPGMPPRRGGRSPTQPRPSDAENLRTWNLHYVPWIPEDFTTGNPGILRPDDTQFLVTWTVYGEDEIGFCWGPGGEWVPLERQ